MLVVVEARFDRSYGSANSKAAARKRVREAQARANEARLERERQNVDDAASFLIELGRLAAADEWGQGRVVEIHAEGGAAASRTPAGIGVRFGCSRARSSAVASRRSV